MKKTKLCWDYMIILICICNVKCKLVLTTTERFTILEDFFRYDFSIIWFSIFISNFIVVEARIQRRICSELNFQQQTRSSYFYVFPLIWFSKSAYSFKRMWAGTSTSFKVRLRSIKFKLTYEMFRDFQRKHSAYEPNFKNKKSK